MKKHKNDFKEKHSSSEHYYDLEFDKGLIEASFAMQYGIRLSHEPDISVSEYYRLLAGIMPDTPLGKIVQIRMESDPNVIKTYGKYEKSIRNEWTEFRQKQNKQAKQIDDEQRLKQLQAMLAQMFSK